MEYSLRQSAGLEGSERVEGRRISFLHGIKDSDVARRRRLYKTSHSLHLLIRFFEHFNLTELSAWMAAQKLWTLCAASARDED